MSDREWVSDWPHRLIIYHAIKVVVSQAVDGGGQQQAKKQQANEHVVRGRTLLL